MKTLLLIGLLCTACTKPQIKQNVSQTPLAYIAFRNYTTMQFNYDDGCEANIVQTGVTKYLTSGTDTICSFKVDSQGVLSWKARQGHVVTFGGCNMLSLTISQ